MARGIGDDGRERARGNQPVASGLDRFVAAQDAVYRQVRAELARGEKQSHWMWFFFPQLAGLGTSPMAQRYAIGSLPEARAYLRHRILGRRLAETTQMMLGWAGRRSAVAILGPVDALKFCSSMTLFELAATGEGDRLDPYGHALDAFCQGRRDERTLQLLDLASVHAA
ncbi:DUF1810 domain-containing protein [Novosphingobium soli]|uniref:DUF1810 domain-containing protein n=1 Tax=Novosphingobium soli TaxID=574956 RepID=A0ABV6CUW1_9SPHN